MKQRGRPVLGAIAGLFFGIFVSLDLFVFGVLPLESNVLAFIPLLGLVAGVAVGMTAPLRRKAGRVHVTRRRRGRFSASRYAQWPKTTNSRPKTPLPNFDPKPDPGTA